MEFQSQNLAGPVLVVVSQGSKNVLKKREGDFVEQVLRFPFGILQLFKVADAIWKSDNDYRWDSARDVQ